MYKEKLIDGSIIRIQMKTNCPKTNIFFASFFVLSLIVGFIDLCAVNKSCDCYIFILLLFATALHCFRLLHLYFVIYDIYRYLKNSFRSRLSEVAKCVQNLTNVVLFYIIILLLFFVNKTHENKNHHRSCSRRIVCNPFHRSSRRNHDANVSCRSYRYGPSKRMLSCNWFILETYMHHSNTQRQEWCGQVVFLVPTFMSAPLLFFSKTKHMKNYSQAIERLHADAKEVRSEYIAEENPSRATQLCRKWSDKIEKLLQLEKEQCNELLFLYQ